MKKLFLLLSVAINFTACQPENNGAVLNSADYESLLQPTTQKVSQSFAEGEINFWQQKLTTNPENQQYLMQLAGAYSLQFREDGNIEHIHSADQLYKKTLKATHLHKASVYRALAVNAITRHSFQEAYDLINEAIKIGSDQAANHLLLFDAAMELGYYHEAKQALEVQKQQSHFHYLIRASKWADHAGDLDKAIALMEKAFEKKKNDPALFQWTKSNLGDMYGHAGRVTDAYQAYLEVLSINPQHWRSWQGLAWIAYANDGNLAEAERIINFVLSQSLDPQLLLLKSDLAASKGDENEAIRLKKEFYKEASNPEYGNMYNTHLALIEAEDLNLSINAIERLEKELEMRETPEVYQMLAWAHHLNAEHDKARDIAEQFVIGKTFEPDALYHLGMIYAQNGEKKKARALLNEALEATFELGPITTAEIRKTLGE